MRHRPLLLLTGFEPFGGSAENPSATLVGLLGRDGHSAAELACAVLPVVGGTDPGSAQAILAELVRRHRPDAVVCFGEAHLRGEVSVERVAVNLRDYRIPDNAGAQVRDLPVEAGAPDARFATLPVRAIVEALRADGIPAGDSLTAGAFLCNEVMFRALELGVSASGGTAMLAGFVHLPQLESQHRVRPCAARPIAEAELLRAGSIVVAEVARACAPRVA